MERLLRTRWWLLAMVVVACCLTITIESVEGSGVPALGKRTFSSYGKFGRNDGRIGPEETVLLEESGAGCVLHWWFAADYAGVDKTIFRVYVNGEESPSIEDLMVRRAYWTGDKRFGSVAEQSFYMAIPIPFQNGIRITAQLSPRFNYPEAQYAYWTIRGVRDIPATVGAFELPPNAKLSLVSKTKYLRALQNEPFLELSGSGGLVYHVEVNIKGKNLDFMEGPVVAHIDGAEHVLGTGLDDYFNSAWWMSKSEGRFTLPGSVGVLERGEGHLVAYRLHEHDPLLFTNAVSFMWQNGYEFETGKPIGNPTSLRATFDFWVYTWPSAPSQGASGADSTVPAKAAAE